CEHTSRRYPFSHPTYSCAACLIFFSLLPPPPRSTLFPYTTLFRSHQADRIRQPEPPDRPLPGSLPRRPHHRGHPQGLHLRGLRRDRKSTRLNSSHVKISYAVFCLKKKNRGVGGGVAPNRARVARVR